MCKKILPIKYPEFIGAKKRPIRPMIASVRSIIGALIKARFPVQ